MKKCFITALIAVVAAVAAQGQTVYRVKYKSEAEWKDKSKRHLMYCPSDGHP